MLCREVSTCGFNDGKHIFNFLSVNKFCRGHPTFLKIPQTSPKVSLCIAQKSVFLLFSPHRLLLCFPLLALSYYESIVLLIIGSMNDNGYWLFCRIILAFCYTVMSKFFQLLHALKIRWTNPDTTDFFYFGWATTWKFIVNLVSVSFVYQVDLNDSFNLINFMSRNAIEFSFSSLWVNFNDGWMLFFSSFIPLQVHQLVENTLHWFV